MMKIVFHFDCQQALHAANFIITTPMIIIRVDNCVMCIFDRVCMAQSQEQGS